IGVATTIEERPSRVAPAGAPESVDDVRIQCGEALKADLTTLIPGEVRLRTRIGAVGTVDPVADVHEGMADQLSQGRLLAEESGRWQLDRRDARNVLRQVNHPDVVVMEAVLGMRDPARHRNRVTGKDDELWRQGDLIVEGDEKPVGCPPFRGESG